MHKKLITLTLLITGTSLYGAHQPRKRRLDPATTSAPQRTKASEHDQALDLLTTCPFCAALASSTDNLARHVLKCQQAIDQHQDDTPFICPLCRKNKKQLVCFSTIKLLLQHTDDAHIHCTVTQQIQQPTTHEQTQTTARQRADESYAHEEIQQTLNEPTTCPYCKTATRSTYILANEHIPACQRAMKKDKQAPFICPFCRKNKNKLTTFRTRKYLYGHVRNMHAHPQECHICRGSYRDIARHIRETHPEQRVQRATKEPRVATTPTTDESDIPMDLTAALHARFLANNTLSFTGEL